jgi:hypothetical protein
MSRYFWNFLKHLNLNSKTQKKTQNELPEALALF